MRRLTSLNAARLNWFQWIFAFLIFFPVGLATGIEGALAQSSVSPIKVACVGDSITWGVGASSQFQSYPFQLARMLGAQYDVHDLGVSGRTLLSHADSPYIKTGYLAALKAFQPNIVVIMLGTNDTKPQNWPFKDEFIQDYLALIASIQAVTSKPQIILCTPPYCPRMDSGSINEPDVLLEIPMIRSVAKQTGLPVVDVHAATNGMANLFPDRIHPTNAGHHLIACAVYHQITGQDFTGELPSTSTTDWNGFTALNFEVAGRMCYLVEPKTPLPGNPWIWRTEFSGSDAQADKAVLAKGYYLAFMDAHDMYGAPAALNLFDQVYDVLKAQYHLAPKMVLEGFGSGALDAFNWAARHPDRVALIYADSPVCDFKSWPGGKGKAKTDPKAWGQVLRSYGFTEEQALAYTGNLVNNLAPLARAKIPILGVYGEADAEVPPEENILLVQQRYQQLGGEIRLIAKPDAGHYPQSLADPAPIIDFITAHYPSL
jgi:lysophospholipase L1-like esterase/pimeloyl-ACP methyl ester carboxylesterase